MNNITREKDIYQILINANSNNILSEDKNFKYAGVNPCAEEPLPAGGSCLLGSINLSEFVVEPFTKGAIFDKEKFKNTVADCVVGLNEVLDEGLELHPLKEQRESVRMYRQIGLGVMGIADMLIKLNIRYGSEESIALCEELAKIMLNSAVKQSALIAKELGKFDKYNEKAISIEPKNRWYREQLAKIYKKINNIEKAAEQYNILIKQKNLHLRKKRLQKNLPRNLGGS